VHEALDGPKYLDAVVLAFAGIIRLWANPSGQTELIRLLEGVRWMVLPLRECPAAPGQGALAIECRAKDEPVRKILSSLHHPATARAVQKERQLLADWGGGCHQKFGATLKNLHSMDLLYIRGEKADHSKVSELRWNAPTLSLHPNESIRAWEGGMWREKAQIKPGNPTQFTEQAHYTFQSGSPVFVAHSRALNPTKTASGEADFWGLSDSRIWTSGTASWFRLAELGHWVEGCSENLGFDELIETLNEPVLRLGSQKNWTALTHSKALSEWSERRIEALATYEVNLNYGQDAIAALRVATHVFWSSGSQYDELKDYLPMNARVACGPGYTATRLVKAGLKPELFPSAEEWRKWLKI
jgi:hydroxymethylbilane synthase